MGPGSKIQGSIKKTIKLILKLDFYASILWKFAKRGNFHEVKDLKLPI